MKPPIDALAEIAAAMRSEARRFADGSLEVEAYRSRRRQLIEQMERAALESAETLEVATTCRTRARLALAWIVAGTLIAALVLLAT